MQMNQNLKFKVFKMSYNKKQVSCLHLLKTTIFSYQQTFKTSKQLTKITPKFFLQNKITTRQTILVSQIKLIYSVVCCCQLNDTQIFDEHLFGQVSSHTGCYKLPIFCCTNVHLGRYTCSLN